MLQRGDTENTSSTLSTTASGPTKPTAKPTWTKTWPLKPGRNNSTTPTVCRQPNPYGPVPAPAPTSFFSPPCLSPPSDPCLWAERFHVSYRLHSILLSHSALFSRSACGREKHLTASQFPFPTLYLTLSSLRIHGASPVLLYRRIASRVLISFFVVPCILPVSYLFLLSVDHCFFSSQLAVSVRPTFPPPTVVLSIPLSRLIRN